MIADETKTALGLFIKIGKSMNSADQMNPILAALSKFGKILNPSTRLKRPGQSYDGELLWLRPGILCHPILTIAPEKSYL